MAPVDFYYMQESPPCRAVEMVANMAGVELNKRYVNLFLKDHLKEEYLMINPLHKVPFIVDGDLKIGESRAIMAYLVNKYMPSNNSLYPADPIKRAQIDELLFFDVGTLYLSASKLLTPMIFGNAKELDSEAEKSFRANLEFLENRLKKNGKKYLLGDDLTIADISIVAGFSLVEACGYDLSDFKLFRSYLEQLKTSIPKYSEINDEANENFKKFVQSKQQQK